MNNAKLQEWGLAAVIGGILGIDKWQHFESTICRNFILGEQL